MHPARIGCPLILHTGSEPGSRQQILRCVDVQEAEQLWIVALNFFGWQYAQLHLAIPASTRHLSLSNASLTGFKAS